MLRYDTPADSRLDLRLSFGSIIEVGVVDCCEGLRALLVVDCYFQLLVCSARGQVDFVTKGWLVV